MATTAPETIVNLDVYRVAIPLAEPYHLSKVYGTRTHADAVIVRMTTAGGAQGWGEGDPGGFDFTGDTGEMIMASINTDLLAEIIGTRVDDWVESGQGLQRSGSWGAALDIAAYDALGKLHQQPVWALLGEKRRDEVDSLWPTSSGTADADLQVIQAKLAEGFRTFMLKMGSRSIDEDVERLSKVAAVLSPEVGLMVDANQGWQLDEALEFADRIRDVPLVLIEQPLAAADHSGLAKLHEACQLPLSVDEGLQSLDDASTIATKGIADIFSIKVSKNGGLRAGLEIAKTAETHGISILMNSMLELGITQSASLHLGCVLDSLVDCGHAYMSTLRMSDDISNFSDFVSRGTAHLPSGPGLGIEVSENKIRAYLKDECHA